MGWNYRNPMRLLAIVGLIILAVWCGRMMEETDHRSELERFFPANEYRLVPVNHWKWRVADMGGEDMGWIYTGESMGYNGPVRILAMTGTDGRIQSLHVLDHTETPSYFQKLLRRGFLEQFMGMRIEKAIEPGAVQAVTGASLTSMAIIRGISNAYFQGEANPIEHRSWPRLGLAEYVILFLFLGGMMYHRLKKPTWRFIARWAMLLVSVIFLGFVLNQPITLSRLASIILGYFPGLAGEFGVYLLIGSSVVVYWITRRNLYCRHVCPFGATQDVLSSIGRAKPFSPPWHKYWKSLQWSVAFGALLLALFRRDPSLAQYEVYPVLFQFTGQAFLFTALALFIIASLFIIRPWCHYACPLDAFFAFVRLAKNTFKSLYK